MRNFVEKVAEELAAGNVGTNASCEWYPCHFKGQNCSTCFCPFYPCMDDDLGEMVEGKNGPVWSCQDCYWVHRHEVVADFFKEMNGRTLDDVTEQDLKDIKTRIEVRHFKKAKRLMVMGATSGAGKSLMCTAFCRVFSNLGYSVVPFKAQNMSLNSVVTDEGEEIARAQELQARGARVRPNSHMNPILLKPKGDAVSQVIVEGRPYGDMDVQQYYGNFTDIEGVEIVRRNIELLSKTSDFVIIEGAGSPAEINMSEHDIVNMRTAEIAQASCVLVVNIEWGGAFAYMYGTLMLLPEEQRNMFGGIIVTNMHGSADSLERRFRGDRTADRRSCARVSSRTSIWTFRTRTRCSSATSARKVRSWSAWCACRASPISPISTRCRSSRASSSVSWTTPPRWVQCEALIIPGTKNTIDDLTWLREKGFDSRDPVRAGQGADPGRLRRLPDARDRAPGRARPGRQGGRDRWPAWACSTWSPFSTPTTSGPFRSPGPIVGHENLGPVRGYEIHMGMTESGDSLPLFDIEDLAGKHLDGAVSHDGMVMGSYLHGSFDLPAFRRFFLSKACRNGRPLTAAHRQGLRRLRGREHRAHRLGTAKLVGHGPDLPDARTGGPEMTRRVMFQGTSSGRRKDVADGRRVPLSAAPGTGRRPVQDAQPVAQLVRDAEGGEIGISQAFQAWGCGIEPSVDMNPCC